MKKFLLMILALVMGIGVFTVAAMADTEDGWTYTVSGSEATITEYTGKASSVTTPTTLGGYKVTAIGDGAFYGLQNTDDALKTVVISEGVKSIGYQAFAKCSSLSSVTFPSTLESIGDYAFNGALLLRNGTASTQLVLPNVKTIGKYAFCSCTGIKSITFKAGLTTIGDYAFAGCTKCLTITFPNTVKTIGKSVFLTCSNLTVRAASGSVVETYAKENNVAFSSTTPNLTVTMSSIKNLSTGIKITWKKNSNAAKYQIYRSVNGGSYSRVKTVASSTLKYTDTDVKNGAKYSYKVRAVATVDGETVTGACSSAKTYYRLVRPTISKLTNYAAGKIKVVWSKNSKATGYGVRYVTGSTATKKSTTNTYKKIGSLTKGKTYKVYVRAYKDVNGTRYYSAYSAVKSIKLTK